MAKEYPKREYFGKLFPKGYLGTEELSSNLYPSYTQAIPGYSQFAVVNFFRNEAMAITPGESRSMLSLMLQEYKRTPTPAPTPIVTNIVTTAVPSSTILNKVGVIIPFDVKNAPGNVVESRLSELLTLKIQAPEVRYPGAKKNELSPAEISIPTYTSSEIVQKPVEKPIIKVQEQISAYTPQQVNIDILSGIDVEMINISRARGKSYTTPQLKEMAKGLNLPVSTRKNELVRTILEGIAKNYGLPTDGSEAQLISSIKIKIDSGKQQKKS